MSEIVPTLFGLSPEAFKQQRQDRVDERALALAQLDPFQRASFNIQRGADRLAGVVGGMLGGQDPELQRRTQAHQLMGMIDPADPDTFFRAAEMALQGGDQRLALGLRDEGAKRVAASQQAARVIQESNSLIAQRGAAAATSQAQTDKIQLGATQERELRAELAKLPLNATEDQIRDVVIKYGDPDKVLTAINNATMRADDREARTETARLLAEARVDAAKAQAEARVDAAREAGATRLQIAQLQTENNRNIAQMQAENKRDLATLAASLKGPSPAVLKAQQKAEEVAEGKETLGDILSTAQTLVKDLKNSGGMSSTSAGALSNLITSTQTGTAGQFLGGVFGTEAQSKRDQLKSVRLQLLNAIKQATGMSAQQLNSNVELQTYLKSLGSEGMTAEANLAIIDNLSKTYLSKGTMSAPKPNAAAAATASGGGLSAAEQAELNQLRSRFGRGAQ